ncbi:nucleotidyltransferase family protein [Sphingomonas sp. ac-8]|uniref:nucleotidyltransferase family protein n=1 Tax=Sphingomonas sp. ac-8 TaxID=3242977 RepID=UPI003A804D19
MNPPNKPWRDALLGETASVRDAIGSLNESGLQIVLVVDTNEALTGTITDGDVRRGILRGVGMDDPVSEILHREPMVLPPDMDRQTALQVMRSNGLHQLPVVDEQRRVIGLHLWNMLDTPPARPNTMVIMAGGRGTRLYPHTENCPKPMLPVGGKPMIEHIVERARAEGFERFVFAIHYLGHMLEEHFGDGSRFGVEIDYLREERPLGTGGALGLMKHRPEGPFVVTNGDVLSDVRYGEILDFHVRHNATATMAVRPHEWQHPFGVVHTEGVDITGFEEKPMVRSRINAGIYALDPSVLDHIAHGEHCDMPTLFERVQASSRRTIVYPMHEPWLDVGRPADLELARAAHEV